MLRLKWGINFDFIIRAEIAIVIAVIVENVLMIIHVVKFVQGSLEILLCEAVFSEFFKNFYEILFPHNM